MCQALCLFLFFPPLFNHIYGPSQREGPDKLDNQNSAQVHVQDVFSEVMPVNDHYTKIFLCKDAYEQEKSIVTLCQVL